MNKRWIAIAVAAVVLPAAALAQGDDKGSMIVRARALYLDPANKDTTPLDLSVNSKLFPEVDITYFFSPNLAAELVLTYPQKHDIRSQGGNIGTLKHLPPTLTLQYHLTGMGVRPYAGVGLNYTRFSNVNFVPAVQSALEPSVKKNSYGPAIDLGVDIPVGGGWLVNVDVKKIWIDTDVSSKGTKVGTFNVDPVAFSIGFGKRF